MRKVVIRFEAEADLADAAAWYENESQGLGARFLDAVVETIEHIQESPFRFPIVEQDARRATMRRFPYQVFFRVSDDAVQIMAVLHGRRGREYRSSRIQP